MLDVLTSGKLVGADPEIRTGKTGKPYTIGKAACAQDGDENLLVSLIAFGHAGEALARLKKGDALCIVGRASVSAWLDKTSGEPRAGLRVVVDSLLTPYDVKKRRGARDEGATS